MASAAVDNEPVIGLTRVPTDVASPEIEGRKDGSRAGELEAASKEWAEEPTLSTSVTTNETRGASLAGEAVAPEPVSGGAPGATGPAEDLTAPQEPIAQEKVSEVPAPLQIVRKRGLLELSLAEHSIAGETVFLLPPGEAQVVHQLLPERPTVEQPIPEVPTPEQPLVEQPVAEALESLLPAAESTLIEHPTAEATNIEEPVIEQSLPEQPTLEQLAPKETVSEIPPTEARIVEQPTRQSAIAAEPLVEHPRGDESTLEHPILDQPAPLETLAAVPIAQAPVARQPTSEAASIAEPLIEHPRGEESLAKQPVLEQTSAEETVSLLPAGEVHFSDPSSPQVPTKAEPMGEKPLLEDHTAVQTIPEAPTTEHPTLEQPASEEIGSLLTTAAAVVIEKQTSEAYTVSAPLLEHARSEGRTAEQPVLEQPVAKETVTFLSTVGAGVAEQQTTRAVSAAEPLVEQPLSEQPLVERPIPEHPAPEEAVASIPTVEAGVDERTTAQVAAEPERFVEQPILKEPAVEEGIAVIPTELAQAVAQPSARAERPVRQAGLDRPTDEEPPVTLPVPEIVSPPAEIMGSPIVESTHLDREAQLLANQGQGSLGEVAQKSPAAPFTERVLEQRPQSSSTRETTTTSIQQVDEELPDWLKELVQRGEPPVEAAPPAAQVSPQKETSQDQAQESPSGPPVALAGEQPTAEAKTREAFAGGPETANEPGEQPKTLEAGVGTVTPLATGMETAGIAGSIDREAPRPPSSEAQPVQPETKATEREDTARTGGQPTEPTGLIPPTQVGQSTKPVETSIFPAWMRELVPPENLSPKSTAQPLRTEPPQLRDDERDELPDWLQQPFTAEGMMRASASSPESGAKAFTPRLEKTGWTEESKYPGENVIHGEPLDEVTETEGPLAGVRGILPLALGVKEPHKVVAPSSRESDGARVFESVLAATAEGVIESTPAIQKAARRSWSRWWIYLAVLLGALIPFFIPSDLAGLGLKVNNTTPTAQFYDKIQSLAPGSTVLLAFDYDTGQAVELNPAARVIVQDLARHKVNVVALTTLPTGVQIANSILQEVSQQNPGWAYGENYVNVGYVPGGEAGLRALSDNWLPASEEESIASLPIAQKVASLRDFALAIEFAGSDESLRAWMEQVQPRQQVTFVAAVSAAVESQARNYLAANQLAAFLRGLGGAAEYELFSNQTGLNVRTVDAQSFSHLVIFAIIVLGNLVFISGRLRKTPPSKS